MIWRVQREDVELFRRDLWKDERSFRGNADIGPNEFLKDCFDSRRAEIELRAIGQLCAQQGEPLCPPARSLGGALIALRRIDGIRLFDLIRLLRQLEFKNRNGQAAFAIRRLLSRQRMRLQRIQTTLLECKDLATCPYPMETKLADLLRLLSRIFGAEDRFESARKDLVRFGQYWQSNCCLIPFRDATTKNCLVEESRLKPQKFEDVIERLASLQGILSDDPDYWSHVPIWDIDFSSVEHLTTPEDDPISLHCHEWTDGSCITSPAEFLLLSPPFSTDPFRSAATLLVRYLRFGGRKLAYKIINSQGFEVRFRFDNPLFYFETVREKCGTLSKEFTLAYACVFDLIDDIRYRASNPSPADEALLRVDHFRRFFPDRAEYWQENPGEQLVASDEPGG